MKYRLRSYIDRARILFRAIFDPAPGRAWPPPTWRLLTNLSTRRDPSWHANPLIASQRCLKQQQRNHVTTTCEFNRQVVMSSR
jgi:hypothetical protein